MKSFKEFFVTEEFYGPGYWEGLFGPGISDVAVPNNPPKGKGIDTPKKVKKRIEKTLEKQEKV
jgi:hypothetical protein